MLLSAKWALSSLLSPQVTSIIDAGPPPQVPFISKRANVGAKQPDFDTTETFQWNPVASPLPMPASGIF
jgi:hypothetical protein